MPVPGPNQGPADWIRQLALALDLPFFLLATVAGGGFLGYLLDNWLHTTPWLMLLMGLLGFIAGMRGILQSLARRGGTPSGRGAGNGPGTKHD
jgi:F0F1-type ATP synthase assembly protein I